MFYLFSGQSEWQKRKDDIILKRLEKYPEREKELMAFSDKADMLILKCRKHNADSQNKGELLW